MKTPRPYQERCIDIGQERNALYALQGGLGKTLPAIFVAGSYHGPKLIICTSMAKEQWRSEILDIIPSARVVVLGTAGRTDELDWDTFDSPRWRPNVWVITHWESLIYCGGTLSAHQWDVVVADEAHRIMNRRAKRTLWLKQIQATRKLALTGTPFERSLDQMWSILNWLYRAEFKSYWKFVDAYMIQKKMWHGHYEIIGPNPRTLPALMEKVAPFTIRLTKEQAFPEMPPKVDQQVPVPLLTKQERIYEDVRKSKDIEAWIESANRELYIPNALALLIRLQQIAVDPTLLGFSTSSSKLDWLDDYLLDNPDSKTVVFTNFRETALKVAATYKAAIIVGGEKSPFQQIARFSATTPDAPNVLVGTIAAMGESLDIPAADTAIFLDQTWSSLKMAQAVERIDRAVANASPKAKNIIRLIAPDTVDALIMEALQGKWSQQELVFHFLDSYG